jgi:hypothetical protein
MLRAGINLPFGKMVKFITTWEPPAKMYIQGVKDYLLELKQ